MSLPSRCRPELSHLKARVGLEDPLAKWAPPMGVGQRARFALLLTGGLIIFLPVTL